MDITIYSPKSSIAFYIFNFPIHWYGIIISSAIFLGIVVAYFLIKKKYSLELAVQFLDYSPMVVIYSVLGARLFYVLGDLGFYLKNPYEIIMLNHGGLSLWGAILFGILAIFRYSRKYKVDFLNNLDIFALFMPLCQAIGRWGNFFNQEAYGSPLNSGVKLFIDKFHRFSNYSDVQFYHPTFLYETILNFILFLVLLVLYFKAPNLKKGTITAFYLILYGFIRIFVEHFRIDSVCYFLNIPIAVLLSALAILLSSIFLIIYYFKK